MDSERKANELLEADLRRNRAHWALHFPPPPKYSPEQACEDALRQVPTTHSFGARAGAIEKLHEKVLFIDRALLSNAAQRRELAEVSPATVGSTAARWGLDQFVFTYLGVHDPYYARTHFPAFGVFARRAGETFPDCNATRRDLASPEVGGDDERTVRLQFLLPNDARELACLELGHDDRHAGSFRRYWGFPEFWNEEEYSKHSWEWKYEFHFVDKLPTMAFQAILWPLEERVNPWKRGRVPSPLTDRQTEFADAHSDCRVISYRPSRQYPGRTFVSASARAVGFYLRDGSFPPFIGASSNHAAD